MRIRRPSCSRYARESPICAKTQYPATNATDVTVVPMPARRRSRFALPTIASCAAITEVSIMWAIIWTSPCTLSCSICANERMAMVEAVSPPAWPPMPSQMAIRCSPANAESWLLERTVPTSETTVEYMNSGCEAGEVGKRVTSIQRWLRQCVRERAIRESSERSDAAG